MVRIAASGQGGMCRLDKEFARPEDDDGGWKRAAALTAALDRDAVLAFVLPAWNIYLIENSAIGEMYFMGLFPASKLFD